MGAWAIHHDAALGKAYYFNRYTQQTSWQMPDEVRWYVPASLKTKFTRREIQELKDEFVAYDLDASGSIDEDELTEIFHKMGEDITLKSVKKMIKEIDLDGNGEVEFNEFLQMVLDVRSGKRFGLSTLRKFTMGGLQILGRGGDGDFEVSSAGTASTAGTGGGKFKRQKKKTRKQEREEFIAKLDAVEGNLAEARRRIEELEADNRKLRSAQKSLLKRCDGAERKVEGLVEALEHAKKIAFNGGGKAEVPHVPIDAFLLDAGLGRYVKLFLLHGVTNTRELVVMREEKLEKLGVKVGHRRKLKLAVQRLVERE